jgi:hypothetical protein
MKKIFTFLIGAMLITSASYAQEVKASYGWEEGTTYGPMGSIWANAGKTWTHEDVIGDAANAHKGAGYFKAVVASDAPNEWDNQIVFQDFTAEAKTSYRFSIWAKTDAAVPKINLTCGVYETWNEVTRKGGQVITNEWAKYFLMVWVEDPSTYPLTGTAKDKPNQIRFPIHIYKTGTYMLDDVAILKSTIAGAEIHENGTVLTVDFGYVLEFASEVDKSKFTVTVDGTPVTISSAEMRDLGDDVKPWIDLKLATAIPSTASNVLVSFTGGDQGLTYTTAALTADYTAAPFTNEVAEFGNNYKIVVGKNDIKNLSGVRAYPNPVVDMLNLKGVKVSSTISVCDISGKMVMQTIASDENPSLNVQNLNKGIYFANVTDTKGVKGVVKIVK